MLAIRLRAQFSGVARRVVNTNHRRWYGIVTDVDLPQSKKVWGSAEEAVRDVKSGDVVLSGGTLPTS
jgi:hypothetical protein